MLGLGLVGCGRIASLRHASAIAESGLARLVACFDPDAAKAQALAARLGAGASGSLEHLLALPEVEAVVLASPPDAHPAGAIAALSAGKHVLVEKPLALTVADCERIVQYAEASGKVAFCGYQKRYAPSYRELKRLSTAQDFQLTGLQIRYCAAWPNSAQCLLWHFVHGLDLARYFAGEVVSAQANFHGHLDGEGCFNAVLQHQGGFISTVYLNTSYSWNNPIERVELAGRGEYFVVDDLGDLVHYLQDGSQERRTRLEFTSQSRSSTWYEGFLPELDTFVAACRGAEVEVLSDMANGLETQRLAYAVLASALEGKAIELT